MVLVLYYDYSTLLYYDIIVLLNTTFWIKTIYEYSKLKKNIFKNIFKTCIQKKGSFYICLQPKYQHQYLWLLTLFLWKESTGILKSIARNSRVKCHKICITFQLTLQLCAEDGSFVNMKAGNLLDWSKNMKGKLMEWAEGKINLAA